MRLNGAAFYYDYEDQQFLNVDAATTAQTLINIDESEVTGMELELTALPTDNLTLRAGLGVLDSEVKSGSLSGINLSGNELLLAPGVNFNMSANWTVLTTGSGSLSLLADTSYMGDHYFEIFNIDRLEQEAYWLWNGRVQFDSASENWAVAVWGKNLADEEYRTSVIDLATFGFDYSHIGAPRTFGAEFTYRF
jgi:iron complex outermembrane receptor protein